MKTMTAIKQNKNRWEVTGSIVMDTANTLLESSKDLALEDASIVDFSQVGEVDTSAVSLLLEWRRRANAESKQLSYINFPQSLTNLVALYGVEDLVN
jgi:phospholipid transport system transporter-binding protein